MPRALLVQPWIHDFTAYDFWVRPLALVEIGARLRAAGWETALLDCLEPRYAGRREPLPRRLPDGSGKFDQTEIPKPPALKMIPRKFKRYGIAPEAFRELAAREPRPDVVLVSSVMTYWWTGVAETVAEVRRAFPDAPVIVGGVYATLLPEHARAHTGADLVAAGDAVEALPPLLAKLGLPSTLGPADFPAWDLAAGPLRTAAVLTGRGCHRRCVYCSVPRLHPTLTRREPGEVVEELARLERDFGVTDVVFYDDALRAGGDRSLTEVLTGVIDRALPLRLHAINALHLKGMTPELAGLLQRAGFTTLRFGLETTSPERARALGDKADLADLRGAVDCLRGAGFSSSAIGVYLLAGLPGQPPGEVEDAVRAVLAAGARPWIAEFSPVPGSALWEEAAAGSRFDLAADPLYHNNALLPCAHPELTESVLWQLKKIARDPFRTARG